jgi:hypothetical protein
MHRITCNFQKVPGSERNPGVLSSFKWNFPGIDTVLINHGFRVVNCPMNIEYCHLTS